MAEKTLIELLKDTTNLWGELSDLWEQAYVNNLPANSGIYVVASINEDRVWYIGQSVCIKARISRQHHALKGLIDIKEPDLLVFAFLCPPHELDRTEEAFINSFEPLMNC